MVGDLAPTDEDGPRRLLEQGSIPALGAQAPGAHEHAALREDHPDSEEAVRAGASADLQDLPSRSVARTCFGNRVKGNRLSDRRLDAAYVAEPVLGERGVRW